ADINLFPIIFDQKVSGAIILIQDRTEQEKLIKQSMRLEQSAVLGEFTTIFAHEVRNPINNISSNLQWMSINMDQNDPNQVIIQRLLQNCDRLNALMDTILSYNRINEIEKEKINLGVLVKKVLDRHQLKLNQTNIQTYFEVQPDLPNINGNQRALERVFDNLIDNAMQVMKENGGNLAVKVHTVNSVENKPLVEVSIADNGPGIADEYKDKILKVSFTTKQNGTGIGLIISQKIVQAHEGVIEYDSVPGGTVFYVRIPSIETA
ncbi:MAG: two-component system sensor histidine kinase NtrB, partial [Anaerolineales bacterium]